MFGGNTANQLFPFFLEENPLYYDSNSSTQLGLFGNIPAACNADQIKLKVIDNNDASAYNAPIKRSSESADIEAQNNLQMSFSNLFCDETDRSRSIPQVNTMSNGSRLSYDDEEHHSFTSAVLDNLGHEMEHRNEEFDQFLRFQEEQLAKGLRELKQQHAASLMNIIDGELSRRIQANDMEIESMNRKNNELDDLICQICADAQTWQQHAQYNESMVHALQTSLQQTMGQGAAVVAPANQGRNMLSVACKGCNGKEFCMLLLPCRHLCLCKDCDAMVNTCPVCFAIKTSSVEVYMSW